MVGIQTSDTRSIIGGRTLFEFFQKFQQLFLVALVTIVAGIFLSSYCSCSLSTYIVTCSEEELLGSDGTACIDGRESVGEGGVRGRGIRNGRDGFVCR